MNVRFSNLQARTCLSGARNAVVVAGLDYRPDERKAAKANRPPKRRLAGSSNEAVVTKTDFCIDERTAAKSRGLSRGDIPDRRNKTNLATSSHLAEFEVVSGNQAVLTERPQIDVKQPCLGENLHVNTSTHSGQNCFWHLRSVVRNLHKVLHSFCLQHKFLSIINRLRLSRPTQNPVPQGVSVRFRPPAPFMIVWSDYATVSRQDQIMAENYGFAGNMTFT